jgi:threonine-phosphate decarboxylase
LLERFGHGGDLRTAAESYGLGQDRFVDFSSNMNPLGPPSAVEEIMKTSWRDVVKYPDPAVRELTAKLSEKYGVPPESILVGNGAAELIDLIVRVLKPKRTALARPSFTEYEEAVHKVDGSIIDIPLRAEEGFELQLAAVENNCHKNDLLFFGHPNNPTGKLIPQGVLERLVQSGRRLILDEAFMDFVADESEHSMLRMAASSPNVAVIRSMTKFYSIPGIRLGFIVAEPNTIREMRKLQVHWSVNYLAQQIGTAVLEDRRFEASAKQWLQIESPWLIDQLESLGLQVTKSDVNFLLAAFSEESGLHVKSMQTAMGQKGILIRDASLFQGLNERYFRVAVRLRAENELLVQCLKEMMQELQHRNRGVHL